MIPPISPEQLTRLLDTEAPVHIRPLPADEAMLIAVCLQKVIQAFPEWDGDSKSPLIDVIADISSQLHPTAQALLRQGWTRPLDE